ncbi:LamG-like jellyroll fold domain-containing protein [Draconibacterium mangrovi]|uniref:LamG-like jellyroll fold domain-containing protein n=1 Tax=Draconibacterium mangrovi TaxID=2697469 RepID=UPI0013D09995|nr:LamG-like jellyroll fold domain-containing protein [Draconibacterium mangrovi]
MKTTKLLYTILLIIGFGNLQIHAQTAGAADNLLAQPVSDRNVVFDVTAPGISKTIEFGPDLAWSNEQNFRRAILFMGHDQIDIVRASFQPTYPLVNDTALTEEQLKDLEWRLYLINTYVGSNTNLALNSDHPWVDDWYVEQPGRWEQLIQTTAQAFMDAGHNIVTVGAFNEPDYGWGQGSEQDMYNITDSMNNNPFFDNIRLSGGNTLNCDEALGWYNYLVPAGVDEGNTHQLAGSFDGFANFFQTVRANGHHATADEMHNVVEGLVGYEYGMQTGIWWGAAELARGEMVKAFDGDRIGYAEHRNNWTAAAVYRTPEGKIQAFGGTSERQAKTTTFSYISKDRAVYFDGIGPQRVFALEMPGGTGYGSGQTNAERVINITWGDDVQPEINGTYKLVNRQSGQVLEVAGDYNEAGIYEADDSGANTQQWEVSPVDSRVGGDFSYYRIKPVSSSSRRLDLYGYSLEPGGKISIWDNGPYGNQQWYLDYAEDGWFYIRSRESSYCAEIDGSGNLVQGEKTDAANQQWRFLAVDAPVEFDAPSEPQSLTANANAVSIKLEWTASQEPDVAGYDILRAKSAGGEFNTIARNVVATSFVDNTTEGGIQYFYKVRAMDKALNRSEYTAEVSATATAENDMVEHFTFDNQDITDNTINLNHGVANGGTFVEGKVGAGALSFNGSSDFVQLPENIANHDAISIACWVNWAGFAVGQHLFSFSSGDDEYIYLSPSIGGQTEFGVKSNGMEYTLNAAALPANKWAHLVVTLGENGAYIYLDGQLLAESVTMVIKPSDLDLVMNYIGINISTKKIFEGVIDDYRIYNYQLSGTEVAELYDDLSTAVYDTHMEEGDIKVWPVPANDILHINYLEYSKQDYSSLQLYNMNGAVIMDVDMKSKSLKELDVSSIPTGIYMLRMVTSEGSLAKKIVIKH